MSPFDCSQIYWDQRSLRVDETWHREAKEGLRQERGHYIGSPPPGSRYSAALAKNIKSSPELYLSRSVYPEEIAIKTNCLVPHCIRLANNKPSLCTIFPQMLLLGKCQGQRWSLTVKVSMKASVSADGWNLNENPHTRGQLFTLWYSRWRLRLGLPTTLVVFDWFYLRNTCPSAAASLLPQLTI